MLFDFLGLYPYYGHKILTCPVLNPFPQGTTKDSLRSNGQISIASQVEKIPYKDLLRMEENLHKSLRYNPTCN